MKKFTKILLLIAMIFSDLMTPISVLASEITRGTPSKGDVGINQTVSETDSVTVSLGTLTDEGDVQVTKTVSPTETEGRYRIDFNIKGKDVVNSTEITKPVYVVVVFDKSGSMDCAEYESFFGIEYCADEGTKWDDAVAGAKNFASTLLGRISTAHIGLVTFSDDADVVRDFSDSTVSNSNFESVNFGSASGATNLHSGLLKANELLSGEDVPENANKYIVVISDGQPTYYIGSDDDIYGPGDSTSKAVLDATYGTATDIKTSGTEIFAVGYDLDPDSFTVSGYGSLTAETILRNVASTDTADDVENNITHYLNANPDAVATAFTNIATSISRVPAGINATLTDNVGANFNIVGRDGNTFTSEVIKEITETGTTISFEVELDESKVTSNGWYNTNDGFSLTYTDANGNTQTITSSEDPQVYWTPNVYKYTVNYYKDSVSGTPIATDVIDATNGTIVNSVAQDKYLNNNSLGTIGYEFNSISGLPATITNDSTVINVLYTIKKFSYDVNYYYDNVLDEELSHAVSNVNYGTEVNANLYYEAGARDGYGLDTNNSTSGTVVIDQENEEINIYYKKNSYGYTINYYFNNNPDSDFTKDDNNALFGSVIKAEDNYLTDDELNNKNSEDDTQYFISPVRPSNPDSITIGTNEGNNVINIYYVSTVVTDEDIEKTSNKDEIISGDTPITYTVNYTSVVNNVNKGDTVKVVVTDTTNYDLVL